MLRLVSILSSKKDSHGHAPSGRSQRLTEQIENLASALLPAEAGEFRSEKTADLTLTSALLVHWVLGGAGEASG